MELARANGLLPARRETSLPRVMERIAHPYDDGWAGNFLTLASSHVALIDPAIYCVSRETELVYIELLGGFFFSLMLIQQFSASCGLCPQAMTCDPRYGNSIVTGALERFRRNLRGAA